MAAQAQTPTEHTDDDGGHGEGGGDSLTATLPMREGWWRPFFLFRGCCWLTRPAVESNTAMHAEFQARPDDIILATYPKCGTTWLKALAFAIANRSKHPVVVAGGDDDGHGHPLLTRGPHDLVPFVDLRPATDLAALPSPRILATHLPLQLLPSGTAALGCRIVCLCREPKDAFVSTWHYMNKIHGGFHIELDKALELFCEGISIYGPIWENFLSYWKQTTAAGSDDDDKRQVLFLRYEEMMDDPVRHARMLAEFIRVPFTDEEESGGVVQAVVRLCSFDNLRALAVNSVGASNPSGRHSVVNSAFFRSGKVRDWANYLTEEMAQKLDRVTEEKLRGSGLSF
jgi:hypothetical protein